MGQQLSDQSNLLLTTLGLEVARNPLLFYDPKSQEERLVEEKVLEAHRLYYGHGVRQSYAAAYEGEIAPAADSRAPAWPECGVWCDLAGYSWAAQRGSPDAMLSLAHMHREGLGQAKRDPGLHMFYMLKAAQYGSMQAVTELGSRLLADVVGAVQEGDRSGPGAGTLGPVLATTAELLRDLEPQRPRLVEEFKRLTARATRRLRRRVRAQQVAETQGDKAALAPGALSLARASGGRAEPLSGKAMPTPGGGGTPSGEGPTGRAHEELQRGLAYFLLAADQGYVPAQVRLAREGARVSGGVSLIVFGLVGQSQLGSVYHALQQYDKAIHWYTEAAQQGDSSAMNFLGVFCHQGLGAPKVGELR
jgi:TPR repeat protein